MHQSKCICAFFFFFLQKNMFVFQCSVQQSRHVVLIPHHHVTICHRPVCVVVSRFSYCWCFWVVSCVHVSICAPPDIPTTLPPSTTPPLHPNSADRTVLLGTRTSKPALTGNRGTVPPHASPRALLHDPSRFPLRFSCSSQNVSFSMPLLPCQCSFYVPTSAFTILISCQGSKILWAAVFKRAFCCPNTQSTAPVAFLRLQYFCARKPRKKQMSRPAENVLPQETSHHHRSKFCVRS